MVDKFILDRLAELEFMQGSTGQLVKDAKRFIQSIGAEAVELRAEVKALKSYIANFEKAEQVYLAKIVAKDNEIKALKAKIKQLKVTGNRIKKSKK